MCHHVQVILNIYLDNWHFKGINMYLNAEGFLFLLFILFKEFNKVCNVFMEIIAFILSMNLQFTNCVAHFVYDISPWCLSFFSCHCD